MITGHQEPDSGGTPRTARSSLQNNEACLVGGVVGLAQFTGTGALAGATPSLSGSGASAAVGAGPALSAANPPLQSARAEKQAEAAPATTGPSTVALLQDGSEVGQAYAPERLATVETANPGTTNLATTNLATTGASPSTSAAELSSASIPGAGAPAVQTPGATSAEPSPGVTAGSATPTLAQEAAAQTQELSASFMQAGLSQLNVAATDHDSTAFSTASTYIEAIYDSIVFLGDNIAVANALNYAPLSQLNLLGGISGAVGGGAQLTNLAFTDNDATAVAVAGTWINHAYNSIIVTGNSVAAAASTNYAPATQVNAALFTNADGSFGSLHEANFLVGDNDSTALAQAGLILGNAMDTTSGSIQAALDANPWVSADGPMNHFEWSEPDFA